MIILTNALQSQDPGIEVAIPDTFAHFRLSWAKASFRQYEFGYILAQTYTYSYFDFHYYVGHCNEETTIYTYLIEPMISLHFMLEGEATYHLPGLSPHHYAVNRWQMNYIPAGKHAVLCSGGIFRSLFLSLKGPYLQELVESSRDVSALYQYLLIRESSGKILPHAYIDHRTLKSIMAMLESEVTEKEVPVEFKPHISMLLNLYRKAIKESSELHLLHVEHRELLLDLIQQIKADPSQPYSLITLSRKHHIYYKDLTQAFRKLTGFPLKAYIHEQRMESAYNLVQSSQLSFQEIADKLGYQEITNLHRAFAKRFGKTMSQVRMRKVS